MALVTGGGLEAAAADNGGGMRVEFTGRGKLREVGQDPVLLLSSSTSTVSCSCLFGIPPVGELWLLVLIADGGDTIDSCSALWIVFGLMAELVASIDDMESSDRPCSD